MFVCLLCLFVLPVLKLNIGRITSSPSIKASNCSLNNSKSKALTLFMNKFEIKEAIRITEDNFSLKKGIKYVPVYALFCLADAI